MYRESLAGANNYDYIWNPLWDYQQASTNETDTWNITNNFQIEYRFLTYFRVRGNLQYQMSKSEAERFRSPNETVFSKTDADKKGTYTKSSTTSNSVTGRVNLTGWGVAFRGAHVGIGGCRYAVLGPDAGVIRFRGARIYHRPVFESEFFI